METQSLLMYLLFVIIATSTPGPAVVFIVTNSILHGWQKASYAALGNICGLLLLGIISISGLGSILNTSQLAFNTIKYIGAAYLIYIGIKMIRNKNQNIDVSQNRVNIPPVESHELFLKAFTVAISNPKAIIFLTALFPQFIEAEKELFPQFSILVSLLIVFSFSFLMIYAFLASHAKSWLIQSNRFNKVNRTGGALFIGLGLLLAATTKK